MTEMTHNLRTVSSAQDGRIVRDLLRQRMDADKALDDIRALPRRP